jgi:hypothetical protein
MHMKMINKIVGSSIGVAAALVMSASITQASPNLLVNGGFDFGGVGGAAGAAITPPQNTGGWTANPITLTSGPAGGSGVNQGWALFGGSTDPVPVQSDMWNDATLTDVPESAPSTLLMQNDVGNNWNPSGAFQIVSGITVGQNYTFSIDALTDTGISFTLGNGGILYQIGFRDAALNVVGAGNTDADSPFVPTLHTWQNYNVSMVAPAGAVYAIVYVMLQDNNSQTSTQDMYFDNATLEAAPEPASLAIAGMGLVSSLFMIRRRK